MSVAAIDNLIDRCAQNIWKHETIACTLVDGKCDKNVKRFAFEYSSFCLCVPTESGF